MYSYLKIFLFLNSKIKTILSILQINKKNRNSNFTNQVFSKMLVMKCLIKDIRHLLIMILQTF